MRQWAIFALLALLAGCSSNDTSCIVDDDCFKGEACIDGECGQAPENSVTPNNTPNNDGPTSNTPNADTSNNTGSSNTTGVCRSDPFTSMCEADDNDTFHEYIRMESGRGCSGSNNFEGGMIEVLDQTMCPLESIDKYGTNLLPCDDITFVVEVTDDDRRKYELERFRALFPTPPEDPRREEGLSRKTPAGAFEGYELEFDYGYEGRLFAGKRGKNTWNGHYRMFISEDAPFGIVESINERGEGFEDKGDGTGSVEKGSGRMELFNAGTGAESGLPDLK